MTTSAWKARLTRASKREIVISGKITDAIRDPHLKVSTINRLFGQLRAAYRAIAAAERALRPPLSKREIDRRFLEDFCSAFTSPLNSVS